MEQYLIDMKQNTIKKYRVIMKLMKYYTLQPAFVNNILYNLRDDQNQPIDIQINVKSKEYAIQDCIKFLDRLSQETINFLLQNL